MPEVTKENVANVVNGLKNCFDKVVVNKGLNLGKLVEEMEPIFSAEGYRYSNAYPRRPPEKTNILIIHDTSAGDFILMSGVIREIRRVYPQAKIKILLSHVAKNLAEFCPHVDEIFTHDDGDSLTEQEDYYFWSIEQAEKLLSERIDICYSFTHFSSPHLVMYMCGAKERISYWHDKEIFGEGITPFPLTRPFNLLSTRQAPPFLYGSHHVDCNFALLDFVLGAPVADRRLEIWCSKEDVAAVKNLLQGREEKLFTLNMGGSGPCKHYPPEKYAELVKMILQEEPDTNFIILGGGDADEESAKIFRQSLGEEIFSKNFVDATNKLTYRQSAAAITFCKLYIGNDTGTMHAAAVGRPVLAVFAFPADLPRKLFDTVFTYAPYNTPSVIVRPAHALPGCESSEVYTQYGCKMTLEPHCITQIDPKKIFEGFHLLKERTEKNILQPLYLEG